MKYQPFILTFAGSFICTLAILLAAQVSLFDPVSQAEPHVIGAYVMVVIGQMMLIFSGYGEKGP